MKRILIHLLVISFTFFGCSKEDSTFIDSIDLTDNTNSSTTQLIGGASAQINESGEIFGYRDSGYRFYTDDDFVSLKVGYKSTARLPLYDNGRVVIIENAFDESRTSLISYDYGITFSPYDSLFPLNSTVEESKTSYMSETLAWNFSINDYFDGKSFGFFTINKIENGKKSVVSTFEIEGYSFKSYAIAINFFDDKKGWLIAQRDWTKKNSLECFITKNGGLDWEGPFQVGDDVYARSKVIMVLDENTLVYYSGLYGYRHKIIHYSKDGGYTWEQVDMSGLILREGKEFIADYCFVKPNLMFAISKIANSVSNSVTDINLGHLYLSQDMGKNFTLVNDNLLYTNSVYFLDDKIGLVISDGVVQKTMDGGETWKTLVFPFSEFD